MSSAYTLRRSLMEDILHEVLQLCRQRHCLHCRQLSCAGGREGIMWGVQDELTRHTAYCIAIVILAAPEQPVLWDEHPQNREH